MIKHIYILGTILFTGYEQLILKWRIAGLEINIPHEASPIEKLFILTKLLLDPFILSGFVAAFIASLFWMNTMSKFDLTHACPFISLAPVLVLVCVFLFLAEAVTRGKVLGIRIGT